MNGALLKRDPNAKTTKTQSQFGLFNAQNFSNNLY